MRARAVLIAAGVLIMGYAVGGALADPGLKPGGVLLFLAGVLLGHDVVVMPVVLVGGAALTRLVPRRHRTAARVAAIIAAAVTVVALPLVLGFGRQADNPSALPSPYGRNLAAVLLAVAVAALLVELWRGRRAAGRKKSARPRGAGAGPSGG